jgi:hypothetical protein
VAESGLISGALGGPNAKPAIPINNNMLPNSFVMDLLFRTNRGRSELPRPRSNYFLRRPRITSTAPEISANALPAEAGLISGVTGIPKAAPPTPIINSMYPTIFTVDPPDLLLDDFF